MQNPLVAKGCKCTKSRCVKGYCECFAAGRGCLAICCCTDCANVLGVRPRVSDEELASLTQQDVAKLSQGQPKLAFKRSPEADLPVPVPVPVPAPVPASEPTKTDSEATIKPAVSARKLTGRQRAVRAAAASVARRSRAMQDASESLGPYNSSESDDGGVVPAPPAPRRHGLDELIAATEAVAAHVPAQAAHVATDPKHPERNLLSGAWDDLLPSSTHLRGKRSASAAARSSPATPADGSAAHFLRRAVPAEAAAGPPQTCFLLPAGTQIDMHARYVVTPVVMGAPGGQAGVGAGATHGAHVGGAERCPQAAQGIDDPSPASLLTHHTWPHGRDAGAHGSERARQPYNGAQAVGAFELDEPGAHERDCARRAAQPHETPGVSSSTAAQPRRGMHAEGYAAGASHACAGGSPAAGSRLAYLMSPQCEPGTSTGAGGRAQTFRPTPVHVRGAPGSFLLMPCTTAAGASEPESAALCLQAVTVVEEGGDRRSAQAEAASAARNGNAAAERAGRVGTQSGRSGGMHMVRSRC